MNWQGIRMDALAGRLGDIKRSRAARFASLGLELAKLARVRHTHTNTKDTAAFFVPHKLISFGHGS